MENRKKIPAGVLSNTEISSGIFDLSLEWEYAGCAQPGQFVMAYPDRESMLLPRPISICEADPEKGRLRLIYRVAGKGTAAFSALKKGDCLYVLGPVGNGFPTDNAVGKTALLMGGGIGIPPLLYLAKVLKKSGAKTIYAALGYRDKHTFLKDDMEKASMVLIASEDGSTGTKGNVIDAVKEGKIKPDIIYACGPMPMLRAIKAYGKEQDIPAYISLEERMACGVGACLGCVCKTVEKDHHSRVNNARVCTEGPVFNAVDVEI